MKNYLSCRSSSVRALLTLLLFMGGGCLVGKAALFRPEAANSASQRTLAFADRVAYQRAVEEVYWRHRIWPKENPGPKPSLDEVMSQQQIQQKVQVYLHNSQLLADQWQRPITPEQLQAEMERMASHTRQPEVLRELFAALGDDPFVVAECLARPTLSERLVSELWLGSNPVAETQSLGSSVVRTEKESSVATDQPASAYYLPQMANSQVEDPAAGLDHWTATSLTGAPDARAYHTAVWTGAEMIVWGGARGLDYKNTGGRYSPSTDSWVATTTLEAPAARSEHTAVWTGSEMIVWGGVGVGGLTFKSGGRYSPMTDSWIGTRSPSRSRERFRHTAVWTGTEMIIWGGSNGGLGNYLKNGARYNPSTDTWVGLPKPPNTVAGMLHTAVWTGSEMIVWGGYNAGDLNTGGRYNPSTNSWVATSLTGAPDARNDQTAVWTGSEMIVWGGSGALNTGGRYNPTTDSWAATSTTGAPHGRAQHTAVWTGTEMIVWGGSYLNTGGRYNPITGNWVAATTTDAPAGRQSHTAVWTGSEMIVWGGQRPEFLNTGGRYSP
jgi:hypothetical protein